MVRSKTPLRLAVLFLSLAMAPAVYAGDEASSGKNLAQSLFEEGRRLMDAGRYAEACPRFADSERLEPGGGTVLNLALCYERLGKLALAYTTYNDALSQAIADRRRDREDYARERIAALAPRLPRITVRMAERPSGFEVRLDGTRVPDSALDTAMPVDPGRHTLDGAAPGRPPWQAVVTLAESEAKDVTIAFAPPMPGPLPGECRGAGPDSTRYAAPASPGDDGAAPCVRVLRPGRPRIGHAGHERGDRRPRAGGAQQLPAKVQHEHGRMQRPHGHSGRLTGADDGVGEHGDAGRWGAPGRPRLRGAEDGASPRLCSASRRRNGVLRDAVALSLAATDPSKKAPFEP